jgi:ABC-2 type transport system permease protein
MPPTAYVAGKVGASMVFGALIVLELGLCGVLLGGVRLAAGQWALLASVLILGSIPFCAIGLAIGFFAGPNSAPAIVNLVYLPAGFASGLLIPIEILPRLLQGVAPWLPQYHLGQLALAVIGEARSPRPAWNMVALGLWAAAAVAAAALAYRRDEGKLYG